MWVCILSNKGWKFWDDFCLGRRGMPKYLSRSWAIGMYVREEILCCISEGVLREKNNLDLETLQIWPDASLNYGKNIKEGCAILNISFGK